MPSVGLLSGIPDHKSPPATQFLCQDPSGRAEGPDCARKPNGLICWEAAQGNVTAHEPTVFDGVGKVTALALRQGEGCAISEMGLGCFRLNDRALARGGTGVPEDFVAFGAAKRMFCARGPEGVSCFTDKIEDIKPIPVFEKPRDLHPTLRGNGICAEYEYELRCFGSSVKSGQHQRV